VSIGAITLITYLWHYLVARLAYDHLLRPLIHGHVTGTLLLGAVAAAGFVIGRWSRRRRA
jgi:hypothetical protein